MLVLKDNRFASDRRNISAPARTLIEKVTSSIYGPLLRNMAGADEPDHTRLRALVQQAFTMRRIEELRGRMEAFTAESLDRVAQRREWDIISDYALPLPVTIIADMLGVPESDRARFHAWSDTLVRAFGSSLPRMLFKGPNVLGFLRYIRSMVRFRRNHPKDDLISALVMAEEAGNKLTEDEMVAMILLLMIAGHETTVNLIGNGTLALLENPDQMERLCANPALIPLAVEEFARYYSPADYGNARWTRCDLSISDVKIPKGQAVIPCISSANRDETKFERPDVLDIAREPNRHVAFGQGIHHCLGVFLARLEAQIAFTTLLERYPDLQLAVPRESLQWRPSMLLRGLESLPVRTS